MIRADAKRAAIVVVAMFVGLGIGRSTAARGAIEGLHVGATNVPITVGLIAMMVAPLAGAPTSRRRWAGVVGPLVLFGFALIFLHNHPQFMAGVALVGLGRCIALVGWGPARVMAVFGTLDALACGLCAVALLDVFPPLLGVRSPAIQVGAGALAGAIGIYFGVPFILAAATRALPPRARGRARPSEKIPPAVEVIAWLGMSIAVTALFAINGHAIVDHPTELPLILVPLALYFVGTRLLGGGGATNTEFGVAIAVGLFGVGHGAPIAASFGPVVDGAVAVALAAVAPGFRRRYARADA